LKSYSPPPIHPHCASPHNDSASSRTDSILQLIKLAYFPKESKMSPKNQTSPFDKAPGDKKHRQELSTGPAILIRRLPKNLGLEALRSMLVFAKDFNGAHFVGNASDDVGFQTAVARFQTIDAAYEATAMLDGKKNTTGDAHMIVSVLETAPSPTSASLRRNNLEPRSPDGMNGTRSSKFNDTFQALDRVSPNGASNYGESPDSYTSMFPNPSSIGSPLERQRVSGKSVIREDGVDDETGKLLNDPVAFANDMANGAQSQRRSTGPQPPTSRFSSLTINPTAASSTMNGLGSPRGGAVQSPTMFPMPAMSGMTSPTGFMGPSHMARTNLPAANPADQNPPCNTLYVGNLPVDTSEDELKMIFSKQRGYKRLCFRTKSNGPMCFVEFEDITFATKALNELYGQMLSNSIKGGIRLSFSKNPLGVRNGQHTSPMSPGPTTGMNGYVGLPPFAAANGPPPGLSMPPGLNGASAPVQLDMTAFAGNYHPLNTGTSHNPMSPNGAPNGGSHSPNGISNGTNGYSNGTNGYTNGTSNQPLRSPGINATNGSNAWNSQIQNSAYPGFSYRR
jgi:hypothetical protein